MAGKRLLFILDILKSEQTTKFNSRIHVFYQNYENDTPTRLMHQQIRRDEAPYTNISCVVYHLYIL